MSIVLYHITYNSNNINIIIKLDDYSKIKKYFKSTIIRFIGPIGIITSIKNNTFNIIKLFLIILLIFFYSNIIIKIEILTTSQELNNLIANELYKANLDKYSLVKKDKYLNKVKENILTEYKDQLEWLNIERKGMKYIINLEPKIKKEPSSANEYCHVIATRDATITKIYSSSGTEVKEVNENVKKGDILISGDIKTDTETKGYTCATGTVYGNTWYTITIELPKTSSESIPTGKTKTNITLKYRNKQKTLLKSPFEKSKLTHHKMVNILWFTIYWTKEQEIIQEYVTYNDQELERKVDKLVDEKMEHTLNGKSQIIYKKVLKKNDNNSTIYLDIFIVAEEEIGTQTIATKIEE